MKVTERITAISSCFCKLAPCEFYHLSCFFFPNQKERTRAPARFPVLKGPIRRQTVRAKQVISHCLTPHSSIRTNRSSLKFCCVCARNVVSIHLTSKRCRLFAKPQKYFLYTLVKFSWAAYIRTNFACPKAGMNIALE